MLTARIQVRLLDDQIDHLDGIILVHNQPLDGTKGDGTFPHHQNLPNTIIRRRGQRGLLLLVLGGQARPLLR